MTGKIDFYTNPMSRGQIARWMLEEVGAPYETHIIDYARMKDDAYLAVNPMGKVPAIRHDGKTVTEGAAICAYLAAAFPAVNLGPEPDEMADYYRWLFFAAGPIEQAVINKSLGFTATADQERSAGYGTYDRVMDVLDAMLSERDYACGGRFTACDVYLGSHVMWGLAFGTFAKRPSFEAYAARLGSREAYIRAKKIDNDLIAAMTPPPSA